MKSTFVARFKDTDSIDLINAAFLQKCIERNLPPSKLALSSNDIERYISSDPALDNRYRDIEGFNDMHPTLAEGIVFVDKLSEGRMKDTNQEKIRFISDHSEYFSYDKSSMKITNELSTIPIITNNNSLGEEVEETNPTSKPRPSLRDNNPIGTPRFKPTY